MFLLQDTEWNDFGYVTSFHVHYFDAAGNLRDLGTTKILQRSKKRTDLPKDFQELSSEFCSLGQSRDYYEKLLSLGQDTAREILDALRDVAFNPAYAAGHAASEGFQASLTRFSEAAKLYMEGGGALFGRAAHPDEGFNFAFSCQLEGFSREHVVRLDFRRAADLPHRVITFVGKNGAGKSGVLARLATTLSGWDQAPPGSFEPERPRFSRVISLSYSVFQPFAVPFVNTTSYRYCGLRDDKGLVNVDALHARTLNAVREIASLKRAEDWHRLMSLQDVFGQQLPDIGASAGVERLDRLLKTLSSGQRIVVSIFSDLLQHMERQSLVLFDEPEIYLHPTLLSTLMRMLNELLRSYDAYAIVATHSPIVVQEIPARSVRVFERLENVPSVAPLSVESFGENLTEIVNHVFRLNEDDKNYKEELKKLARNHSYDEVVAMFDGRLGMNARMFLLSLSQRD